MTERRQVHLGFNVLGLGQHPAGWKSRYGSDPQGPLGPELFEHCAKVAERGTFDAFFLADTLALRGGARALKGGPPHMGLDPTALLSYLAAVTERIGLIATVSSSFEFPYNLARRIASVDRLSHGRAAWNIVTTYSPEAVANFSADEHLPREARYARAAEFANVVTALWGSWDEDAIVADAAAGVFVEPDRVEQIDHRGEFFSVAGPLPLPPSEQGRPVIVQAGGSPEGLELAASYADMVFSSALSFEHGQAFYSDLKGRVAAHGRDPQSLKIMPGLTTVIGGTEAEANQRYEELEELAGGDSGLGRLSEIMQLPPDQIELDRELPWDRMPPREQYKGSLGFYDSVIGLAKRRRLTVRQLLKVGTSHRWAIGAPEQIADTIEEWVTNRAADGFNIMTDVNPSGIEAFVEHVVPILRRRGIYRHEYTGTTLRDHLGLPRPRGHAARNGTAMTAALAVAATPD
jgi:FMN-dependent oxidoreductase (nitrilotriacetate monooxygenase family)